jgi:aspartate racemase
MIGIVGGAGPLAGTFLAERIFRLAQERYGAHYDRDFPELHLLSYPFSDMLSPQVERAKIAKELFSCLQRLRNSGAKILAIACNTLHLFLDDIPDDLVHLPNEVGKKLQGTIPLVLCTSTSAKGALHRQFFPCLYPDEKTQRQVDRIIDEILQGKEAAATLIALIQQQTEPAIVLGCTELSLVKLPKLEKTILDPLEIAAEIILEKSWSLQ